jgi:hypothetical protein
MFLLSQLPAAFFAGLKLDQLTQRSSSVSVRQKWFNKNPFHSIYFAILAMAAEVSTGVLCLANLYKRKPPVSMLVVKNEGFFYKKGTGKIVFTCNDGNAVSEAIEKAIQTRDAASVTCNSKGINEKGELVAEFNFTWSFKPKG